MSSKEHSQECSNYCTHCISQQGNVQNPPRQASAVCDLKTSRCTSWVQRRQAEGPKIKLPSFTESQRKKGNLKKKNKKTKQNKTNYFCFIDYAKAFNCVGHNKLWKILQEMGIPHYFTCLLRNLYVDQEATVRTGHGTTD